MSVPMQELARRLCVANHRSDLGYPSNEVPCSVHVREAKLYVGLTDASMTKTLGVITECASSPALSKVRS